MGLDRFVGFRYLTHRILSRLLSGDDRIGTVETRVVFILALEYTTNTDSSHPGPVGGQGKDVPSVSHPPDEGLGFFCLFYSLLPRLLIAATAKLPET